MKTLGHIAPFLSSCFTLWLFSATTMDTSAPDQDQWRTAEESFVRQITPELERIRKILKNPDIGYMRIEDKLIEQYLPDFRLYVTDSNLGSSSRIFCVDRAGHVFDLGFEHWTSKDEAGNYFYLPKINDFLISQNINIKSKEDALKLTQLIETMIGAPDFVSALKRNTNNFKTLNIKHLKDMFSDRSNYKLTANLNWERIAAKTDSGWKITLKYIGPPASITCPPTYIITVENNGRLADIECTFVSVE